MGKNFEELLKVDGVGKKFFEMLPLSIFPPCALRAVWERSVLSIPRAAFLAPIFVVAY